MAGPRIPLALQAVFTESNQGQEVHKPPTEKVAFKTFFRGFFRTIRGKSNKREQGSPSSVGESSTFEKEKRKQVVAATRKPTAEKGHGGDDQDETFSISQETTLTSGSSLPSTVVNLKVAKSPPKRPPMSPQAYLDLMIHSRGYSTRRFRSVQTGYYNKPTKFQQASYNVHLIKLARKDEVQALREIFEAGISPNPANAFGESLMHMVCRRGHFETLRMMLGTGATVQVCDDYGR